MTSARHIILAVAVFLAAAGAGVVWHLQPSEPRLSLPKENNLRTIHPAEGPRIEITPEHELARVSHLDATGYSPLEIVQTARGPITIQRVFDAQGNVLSAKAFIDGKPTSFPANEENRR